MQNTGLKRNARALRKNSTEAETVLWKHLRNRRFSGYKFRRQHVIDPFIVDFYCVAAKLAIEVDGAGHALQEQVAYDAHRTSFLKSDGVRVLRFWNHEVLRRTDDVLKEIHRALVGDFATATARNQL